MFRTFIITAGICIAGLLLSAIRPVWAIDPDAAAYISLGQSIAFEGTYELGGQPHGKYPPGFPLLLSLLMGAFGGEAYGVFHGTLVILLLVGAGLSVLVALRMGVSPTGALAIGAATALSQTFFELSIHYLRSEALFLALTTGTLLAFRRALEPKGGGPATVFGAAVLLIAAIATRLAGITLLVIPALALLRKKEPSEGRVLRLRAIFLIVVGLATLGVWELRAAKISEDLGGSSGYGSELLAAEPRDLTKIIRLDNPPLDSNSLQQRVLGNLDVLARASASLLTNVDRAAHRLPVGALLLVLVLTGLCRMALAQTDRIQRREVAAYVTASLALYLLWPFNQQERFYAPLLPFLLLAAGEGVSLVWSLARSASSQSIGRRGILFAGAVVLSLLAIQTSDHPVILERWSSAYAGLLGVGLALLLGLWRMLRKGILPEIPPAAPLLIPLLFALPLGHHRLVLWPKDIAANETVRAERSLEDEWPHIDLHPIHADVARFIRKTTKDEAVIMTDVPKMMSILTDRRCIPLVYRLSPPEVHPGKAIFVYYTGEIIEALKVIETVAKDLGWIPVWRLDPVWDGTREVVPTVWRIP